MTVSCALRQRPLAACERTIWTRLAVLDCRVDFGVLVEVSVVAIAVDLRHVGCWDLFAEEPADQRGHALCRRTAPNQPPGTSSAHCAVSDAEMEQSTDKMSRDPFAKLPKRFVRSEAIKLRIKSLALTPK